MFAKLSALLAGSETRAPIDGREAFAAVLVRAAQADGDFDPGERALIESTLAERYGLTRPEAKALLEAGEAAVRRASDLVGFTRAIKDTVPYEERIGVIEAVLEIAYADGERSYEEAALVRKLCGLLYVEDRDAGLARQRVAARMGAG